MPSTRYILLAAIGLTTIVLVGCDRNAKKDDGPIQNAQPRDLNIDPDSVTHPAWIGHGWTVQLDISKIYLLSWDVTNVQNLTIDVSRYVSDSDTVPGLSKVVEVTHPQPVCFKDDHGNGYFITAYFPGFSITALDRYSAGGGWGPKIDFFWTLPPSQRLHVTMSVIPDGYRCPNGYMETKTSSAVQKP